MLRYIRNSNGSCTRSDVKPFSRSKFDDSVVDSSAFRPNVDDVHNFTGGGSNMTPLYEFPDGVDNGLRLGSLRSLGADITEIDATKKALQSTVDNQKKKFEQDVADTIHNIKENLKAKKELKDVSIVNTSSDSV